MAGPTSLRRYSFGEEVANSVSHGVGLVLAIAGLTLLVVFSSLRGNAWEIVACSVYGATLVLLYAASTLYHSVRSPRLRRGFRALDHAAIFLLIAGTYTPITLVPLRGPWGWPVFGVIWGFAALGIALELSRWASSTTLRVGLYVGMGWVIFVAVKPMWALVAPGGLLLLLVGGLAYTSGIAFYLWRRMPYHHAVWHLFVLAGSVLHFFAILFYVR